MKKKLLVMAICMVVGAFFVSSAYAAFGWHVMSISKAGTTTFGEPFIEVTGVAPDTTSTRILMLGNVVDKTKEMYAAALTAFANSTNVWVYCDPALGAGSPAAGVAAMK
jgi:hypothetical protein